MISAARTKVFHQDFGPFGEVRHCPIADNFFTGAAQVPGASDPRTFPAINLATGQSRWLSPDPAGMAAVDITNPQSFNRYAYVLGNPLGFTDPTGMFGEAHPTHGVHDGGNPIFWPSCPLCSYVDFGWGGDGNGGGTGGGGGTPEKPKPAAPTKTDIDKTWSRTFPCGGSAIQLMGTMQNNMNAFAGDRGIVIAADFPNQQLRLGSNYNVFPGINLHAPGGSEIPVADLHVTVTAQSTTGWTFTTDPAHHYFDGTVAFSATNVGGRNVRFSVSARANFSSPLVKYTIGPLIKLAEDNTWNTMLDTVQKACQAFTF